MLTPLIDTSVVTIALNVPGPMAAARLRDLGAQVTKIEPLDGDPLRSFSGAWYAELAAGMTVETWDLKSAGGRECMQELLSRTDLLLTSQRPAALSRLGLDWAALHERFPRLCQVAIVGYPAPDQHVAGHDLTYMAVNGLVSPPDLPPSLFADVGTSDQAALAALALLLERARTGIGRYQEVALADAATRLAQPLSAGLTRPGALLRGGFPGYNLYRCSDGWVAVAALEPHFYQRLCDAFDIATPSYEQIAAQFAARDTAHWQTFAAAHDLPIAVVAIAATQ